ncbi:hypothetical protein A7U60_g2744 [Sanghuangporus baumii]|uniref:Uncharacterized protein n=1 Tax=Sanghuangporus baumii TaxID=108892 RepID=A0A9Q5I252_SANBA|nr:hypothetical protein A7U60_g2744 [Sanghuangporus baumii]
MSDKIKHSQPINIPNNNHSHSRSRSASYSASSDDDSNSPPLRTPPSSVPAPRVNTAYSPSTSPILSYFFHSPAKVPPSPTAGFTSFGRGISARPQEQPIMEEDEDTQSPLARHARRMSTSAGWTPATSRFNPVPPADHAERGAGLLRRLSLGGAFVRVCPHIFTRSVEQQLQLITPLQPQPPSPPAQHAAPTSLAPAAPVSEAKAPIPQGRKKRRASTLGVPGEGGRPRRSPSPMGERILTGHFDGFN